MRKKEYEIVSGFEKSLVLSQIKREFSSSIEKDFKSSIVFRLKEEEGLFVVFEKKKSISLFELLNEKDALEFEKASSFFFEKGLFSLVLSCYNVKEFDFSKKTIREIERELYLPVIVYQKDAAVSKNSILKAWLEEKDLELSEKFKYRLRDEELLLAETEKFKVSFDRKEKKFVFERKDFESKIEFSTKKQLDFYDSSLDLEIRKKIVISILNSNNLIFSKTDSASHQKEREFFFFDSDSRKAFLIKKNRFGFDFIDLIKKETKLLKIFQKPQKFLIIDIDFEREKILIAKSVSSLIREFYEISFKDENEIKISKPLKAFSFSLKERVFFVSDQTKTLYQALGLLIREAFGKKRILSLMKDFEIDVKEIVSLVKTEKENVFALFFFDSNSELKCLFEIGSEFIARKADSASEKEAELLISREKLFRLKSNSKSSKKIRLF